MAEHKMRVFAVMRLSDGLFSLGGYYGIRWRPRGKLWTRVGDVKSHLRYHRDRYARYGGHNGTLWEDVRIVEMELDPDLAALYTLEELESL